MPLPDYASRSRAIERPETNWTEGMLLETCLLVDLLAGAPGARELAEELDRTGEVLRIPSPSALELRVGISRALDPGEEAARVQRLLASYVVIPYDAEAARFSGELQGELSKRGGSLGTIDAQLAGIALARGETLVTGDERLLKLGHGLRTHSYRRRSRQ